MAIADIDKCPHCGTPFMSMLKAGEDPRARYCYSCDTAVGGAQFAAQLASSSGPREADDHLALVPNEGDGEAGARRPGRMAPNRRPINKRPGNIGARTSGAMKAVHAPASQPAMPAVRAPASQPAMPAVRAPASQPAMPAVRAPASQPAMPAVPFANDPRRLRDESVNALNMPGCEIELEEVPDDAPPQAAPEFTGPVDAAPAPVPAPSAAAIPVPRPSATGIPVARPSASGLPVAAPARQGSSANLPPASRGSSGRMPAAGSGKSGRMGVIASAKTSAMLTAVMMPVSRSSARQKAVQAQKTKTMYAVGGGVALVVVVALFAMSGSKPKTGVDDEPVPEKKTAKIEGEPVRLAEAPPSKLSELKKDPEVKKEEPGKTPESAKVETSPAPETAAEKPTNSVADALQLTATKKNANAKIDDDDAEVAPTIKKKAELPKLEPAKAPGPGRLPDANGVDAPKKPADTMVALGLKKKEPEKEDKPDPKAGPAPVTATVPTILPLDFVALGATPENQFSQQISALFPGWRARDFNTTFTQTTGAEVRGRKDVLIVNPINDVMPTKVMCTIEIPASFASKRPVLLFETSVKDLARAMFVSVKVMNVEVVPKTQIRVSKEVAWMDAGVPLAMLAGKRAEISIELMMPPKTKTDKMKDHAAYIRNIRLEWVGKK